MRQRVRFSEGLAVLLEEPHRVLLEAGPGQTLSTFSRRHPALGTEHTVLPTLRHPQEETSDVAFLLNSLGRLWLAGAEVDWSKVYVRERRHRIPLPTYPFERRRFWIDPPAIGSSRRLRARPLWIPLEGGAGGCPSRHSDATLHRTPPQPNGCYPPGGFIEVMPAPQLSAVPPPAPTARNESLPNSSTLLMT